MLLSNDILTLRSFPMQKAHNFECLLPLVGASDPIVVSQLVQSVEYTDYEMSGVNGMRYGAYQSFFAGFMSKRPFTINFIETENQDIKTYLTGWRNLIIDSQGRFQKKLQFLFGYAKPIVLIYTDNNGNPTNIVTFNNAFPIEFSPWKVDYTSSGVQKVQVTFVCDGISETSDIVTDLVSDVVQNVASNVLPGLGL